MPNKKPTTEQIKELWEWCGFTSNAMKLSEGGWNYPRGSWDIRLPPLDLNNLFKYAVPKLQDKGYMFELYSYEQAGYKVAVYHITGQVDIPITIVKLNEPALALFWAIWEVIHGS